MRFLTLKALLLLGLSLLLSACASSVTPPARYMLPSSPAVNAPVQPQATLKVSAPRLADYLDVDGIVMQLDDIALNEAREHQWAESIGRQLERSLRVHLAHELPTIQVVREEINAPSGPTLQLEIDQFQGRYDGVAVASGQWQLRSNSNELLAMKSVTAETELNEDGYPALVRSLGESWASIAGQIAHQLRQGNFFE